MFDASHHVALLIRVGAAGLDGRPAIGLDARTSIELEEWGRWLQGLLAFIDDLAASWRGWAGEKSWSDDHERVQLRATHDGVGKVTFVDRGDALGWMLRTAPRPLDHPVPRA